MLKEPCCFSDVLWDVMKFYHLAPSSKVQVDFYGDPHRLAQVCDTLVSNAVKFGGGRPIHVTLRKTKSGFNLLVKDQGIGMSEEDQARIFERFSRGVATSQVEGMGLSLYLAREIIEAHGGSISVKSKLHHGSTFKVSFRYLENI
jgi:signal transduction histidine kinase